jgi:hypothetical protein
LTSFDFNNFCNSIGGLLLIVAWGVLFFNFWRKNNSKDN